MNIESKKSDARVATRARLVAVFNQLLLEEEDQRPKVARIIAEANISRSTFYDYFDGVEELFNESLAGLLGGIAEALVEADRSRDLAWYFDHIWQNRSRARDMLSGDRGERAEALLARQFERRLADRPNGKLLAILAAGTVMAALRNWVRGSVSGSPAILADKIERTVAAVLAASDN